jgi:16S rRNA processing protein RimM
VTARRPTSTSSTTESGIALSQVAGEPGSQDEPVVRRAELEVGRIAKPHGLKGEVVVDLVTNRTERLEPGTALSTSAGPVLVVEASSPFGTRWIVTFAGVSDREAAEEVRGWKLLAPPIDEPEALWVDELVGASVSDQSGRHLGTVAAVVANPASDLLELEGGALIPIVFVVESAAGQVVVDIPDGLIE